MPQRYKIQLGLKSVEQYAFAGLSYTKREGLHAPHTYSRYQDTILHGVLSLTCLCVSVYSEEHILTNNRGLPPDNNEKRLSSGDMN